TIIFTLNLSGYFARFDALGEENKRISLGLAEACVESAKLKIEQELLQNQIYTPAASGDSITVNGKTCKICGVTGTNPYTIYTDAAVNGTYSHVEVIANIATSTFSVASYSENMAKNNASCTL